MHGLVATSRRKQEAFGYLISLHQSQRQNGSGHRFQERRSAIHRQKTGELVTQFLSAALNTNINELSTQADAYNAFNLLVFDGETGWLSKAIRYDSDHVRAFPTYRMLDLTHPGPVGGYQEQTSQLKRNENV